MVNEVATQRVKDNVHDVKVDRAEKGKPAWIIDLDLWRTMCEYWDSEDAIKRSRTYSKNRKSERGGYGVSKHFGGSKSFDQHETDLTIAAGHPVGIHEVFRKTHFKNGKYADGLSEQVIKAYEEQKQLRQSQLDPEQTSDGRSVVPDLSLEEDDQIFIQASQSIRPGNKRPYGLPKRRAVYAGSSSNTPSGWTDMTATVAAMKEEMERMAQQRLQDEQDMAQIRLIIRHPEFQRLADDVRSQQTQSGQQPDGSQGTGNASNDP